MEIPKVLGKRKRSLSLEHAMEYDKELFPVTRCSGIRYIPQAIECFAITGDQTLCALGRSNGQIELWLTDSWTQILIIPGFKNSGIRTLLWVERTKEGKLGSTRITSSSKISNPLYLKGEKRRLLSVGLNSHIIEWDLTSLQPKNITIDRGGPIWSGALSVTQKEISIASNDGHVRLYSSKEDNNGLKVKREFERNKGKALSTRFSEDNVYIYGGYSLGIICSWKRSTGEKIECISEGEELNICVWDLLCINNQIVGAYSDGTIRIWNSNTSNTSNSTLAEGFHGIFKGDVLALVQSKSNSNRKSFYASGCDSRILSFEQIPNTNNGKSYLHWKCTSQIRGQSHDIKALAIINSYIISGGLTSDICIYNLYAARFQQQFGKLTSNKLRHVPPFPMKEIISFNAHSTLALIQKYHSLELCCFGQNTPQLQIIFSMNKKGNLALLATAISLHAHYFAYSDIQHIAIYQIIAPGYTICNVKIKADGNLDSNTYFYLKFLSTHKLLALSTEGILKIIDLENKTQTNERIFKGEEESELLFPIIKANISENEELLAIVSISHTCHIFSLLRGQIIYSIPRLNNTITAISFLFQDELGIVCSSNELYIFNIQKQRMTDWTKKYMHKLPKNYLNRYNRIYKIQGISDSVIVLVTHYTLIRVDIWGETPETARVDFSHSRRKNNIYGGEFELEQWFKTLNTHHSQIISRCNPGLSNKGIIREDDVEYKEEGNVNKGSVGRGIINDNFKIYSAYSGIIALHFTNQRQFILVETLWKNILKTFPGTITYPKFAK